MSGKFIMLDGIDGSGKSTVMDTWRDWMAKSGRKVCDARAWNKERGSIPAFSWVADADVIVSAEPTHAWVGKAIREEIVREGSEYSGLSIAHSFALDREVLYRRLLLPALAAGKTVLQERGISTSLVYQPIQKKAVTAGKILKLPGNELALKHRPDTLVVMDLRAKAAIERLSGRFDKKDGSIFENLDFVTRAGKRFKSAWLRRLFEKYGTEVRYFPAGAPLEQTRHEAETLLQKLLQP